VIRRRDLIVGGGQVAALLPLMIGSAAATEPSNFYPGGVAWRPAVSNDLWLCAGRSALAAKARTIANELL
jgi:hypothetical protein